MHIDIRINMAAYLRTLAWFMVGVILCFLVLNDPMKINPNMVLRPPSLTFPGGTDRLGRDVLARASAGFRASLAVAGTAEVISLGASLVANLLLLLMAKVRLKALFSVPLLALRTVPPFLTGLALAALLGATKWGLIFALAMISFPFEVAVVEEEINASIRMPHIEGAKAIGLPYYMILLRHVGTIAAPRIMRYALLDFVGLVAFEALLGFVGMTRPPAPSIGAEIYNAGPYIATYPWLFLVPALLLAVGLIVFNAGLTRLVNRR